jgi:acyl-CoA synthetase (AMP-forming)/AMP-acid ligase II
MAVHDQFGSNEISTLVDLVIHRKNTIPDKNIITFLEDGEDQELFLSYGELDQRARAIAAVLQRDHRPGERMILLYPSGLEFIATFFGCLYAGMIAAPTYPPNLTKIKRSLPRFLAILKDARPAGVLTTKIILDMSKAALSEYPETLRMNWVATEDIPSEEAVSWCPT